MNAIPDPNGGEHARNPSPADADTHCTRASGDAMRIPGPLDTRPGRILVADDEEMNRVILSNILGAQGHVVMLVADGQEAVERALAESPDAILLDVMMPRMDGYEACRRLKADPRTAPIPVLIVTSLSDRADRIRGVDAGADDFLLKPIDREELVLRVRNALYRKHLYDALAEKYAELKAMAEIRETLTNMIDADTEALSLLMRRQAEGEGAADEKPDEMIEDTPERGEHGTDR